MVNVLKFFNLYGMESLKMSLRINRFYEGQVKAINLFTQISLNIRARFIFSQFFTKNLSFYKYLKKVPKTQTTLIH